MAAGDRPPASASSRTRAAFRRKRSTVNRRTASRSAAPCEAGGTMFTTSPSLTRDPNKCILCGDCVRMCAEVQGIGESLVEGSGDLMVDSRFMRQARFRGQAPGVDGQWIAFLAQALHLGPGEHQARLHRLEDLVVVTRAFVAGDQRRFGGRRGQGRRRVGRGFGWNLHGAEGRVARVRRGPARGDERSRPAGPRAGGVR